MRAILNQLARQQSSPQDQSRPLPRPVQAGSLQPPQEARVNDLNRLLEWTELLDDDRLACLVEIAAVLAADQIGVYTEADEWYGHT